MQQLQVGRYRVIIIETGELWMDGGAVFGVIPKAVWGQKVQADSLNRVQLCTRSLLIYDAAHCLLLDTGLSPVLPEKLSEFYRIDKTRLALPQRIAELGFRADRLDGVILTHLHFDHVGGALSEDGQRSAPAFPQARYYVQRRNFDWAQAPSELDRASYQKANFQPLFEQGRLELLNGAGELFPDIHLLLSEGHTPGQQMVLIKGEEHNLLFIGDLAPTALHINLTWGSSFDLNPLQLIEEKKSLIQQAAAEQWLVVFPHDIRTAVGTIVPGEKGWQVRPYVTSD